MKLCRPAILSLLTVAASFASTAPAMGFWSEAGVKGTGSAAVSSMNQGTTPDVAKEGESDVVVSWQASTMSGGAGVDGYEVTRYDADTNEAHAALPGCAGIVATTSCTEASVPAGHWEYSVTPLVSDNWRGAESERSDAVTVSGPEPLTQSFSLDGATGAFLVDTTLYYKGDVAGGFRIADMITPAGGRQPASAGFPAIATSGWVHDIELVTERGANGGPFVSSEFTWDADPANPTSYVVTGTDASGFTGTAAIAFESDTAPPSGGDISYPDTVVTSLSVPVTRSGASDTQSGINEDSITLRRAEANLEPVTQECGPFGDFETTVFLTDGADESVANDKCYMYEGSVSDNVGNRADYDSPSVAKVHTSEPPVLFGRADPFAALAASTITNAGPSVITGDLGISPGTACTGLPTPCTGNGPGVVTGSVHAGDSTAAGAQVDLAAAYADGAGRPLTGTIGPELGATTRFPGVYNSSTGTFGIAGTLTLDGNGDPDSTFIFRAATTLDVPAGSKIVLVNGAQSCNVLFQTGTATTLAANTLFRGTINAGTITVGAGTVVDGRLLARDAAVTLSSNNVTRPSCP
ncbi:MAG: hypothetical protein QOI31_1944 [Solirubrobacterales bacterium]|jgi:hypothetical protein|nr:hypothetical protein [Solirubrobacterales bacterium]